MRDPGYFLEENWGPGLHRIISLRFMLRCARDTYRYFTAHFVFCVPTC